MTLNKKINLCWPEYCVHSRNIETKTVQCYVSSLSTWRVNGSRHIRLHTISTSRVQSVTRLITVKTTPLRQAIHKVVFSLFLAVDKGNAVVLVLSIKVLHSIHSIQIICISSLFCLSDTVLSWFNSYLPGNWRSLCIDGSSSVEIRLQFGDPQRFVIGLFKIKMYNSPFTQSWRGWRQWPLLYINDDKKYVTFTLESH